MIGTNNMKLYSQGVRKEILNYSIQNGVRLAVDNYGVNRKTVYKWIRRDMDGLPLVQIRGSHLSDEKKGEILEYAKSQSQFTLLQIHKRFRLGCSLSTLYRILSNGDIPACNAYLVSYKCLVCNRFYRAIAVYYGIAYKPHCPVCDSDLIKDSSILLPFYSPNENEYLLRSRELIIITPAIKREIGPLLCIPAKGIPVFMKYHSQKRKLRVHVVERYLNGQPISHCGSGMSNPQDWEVFNSITRRTKVNELCRKCLMKSIIRDNQTKDLAPDFESIASSVLRRKFKLLKDSATLKNVSLACKINKYSRPTYYSAKREFGEIA